MQQLGFDLLANPKIAEHAMHNYLYLPVINTLTLGIYGMVAPPSGVPAVSTSPDQQKPHSEETEQTDSDSGRPPKIGVVN